jgi:1-acyl-sn-glycerol-3-phosphate acyltransferase
MLRHFARLSLKLAGWRVDDRFPRDDKYVLVVAFHTSNWDFIYGILAKWSLQERLNFVAKHTLFRAPFGYMFRAMGGIPVDRRMRHGFIDKMVEQFSCRDVMKLAILPEGTRSHVKYWKTGFYYIAVQAKVPIALGYFDYANKIVGVGKTFYPSGDIEKDMHVIREFYADKTGKHPQNQGPICLRPDGDESSRYN